MKLFNHFYLLCDAPKPWGVYFQDTASPQMEALIELHEKIMFYLVIILFGVAWIMFSIIRNYVYSKSPISNKYLNHGTLIEWIWTITPALILILIAFPSFKILYLMDEVTDPCLTVFVEGHQWYWSHQYPDFINSDEEEVEFDSYIVPEWDLYKGWLRILEVTNRVIVPDSDFRHISHMCDNNPNSNKCISLSDTQKLRFWNSFEKSARSLSDDLPIEGCISFRDVISQTQYFYSDPKPSDVLRSIAMKKGVVFYNDSCFAVSRNEGGLYNSMLYDFLKR